MDDQANFDEIGVSLSGGSNNTTYFFTTNYLSEDGNVTTSNFERYSSRIKVDSKLNDIISTADKVVKRKEDIIEGFLPHKHTSEGQIRFNMETRFDDEEWLKNNYDTIGDYSFITKENKNQILKSYDNMEKNIKDTIEFVSNTYNNFDERINIYEAEEQKKINEAQNNLNKREYEREKIKFENKEKEQEKKKKIFIE